MTRKLTGNELLRFREVPEWAREIILEAVDQHHVALRDVLASGRSQQAVIARDHAIYRLRTKMPEKPSTMQIGDWIGLDHSSVCVALARHSERTGAKLVTTSDIAARRRRHREYWQMRKAA